MSDLEKLSAALEKELRQAAKCLQPRSALRRFGTIDRLVEACDAIGDQSGSDLIAKERGDERPPRHGYEISPTNIDHYVRGRGRTSPMWTGPARGTLQREPQLLEYVRARESERHKVKRPRRIGPRSKEIELALQSVLPIEYRLLLIEEIDIGKKAIRELQLLKEGLGKIEAIDIDALLAGRAPGASTSEILGKDDKGTLLNLVIRLNDSTKMGRFGLTIEGDRVLQVGALESVLVTPPEMRLLKRLAHYNEIETAAFGAPLQRTIRASD